MRYLHPVAASEKFIAKGIYQFYEGDKKLPENQSWTRHRLAGGGILTRFDHETEERGTRSTSLMEVLADDEGRIERISLRQWPAAGTSIARLRAEYVLFTEYVQASLQIDEKDTIHHELALPTPHSFVELALYMPLYWGNSIQYALDQSTEDVSVFFPNWSSLKFPGHVSSNARRIIENQSEEQVSSERGTRSLIKYFVEGGYAVVLDAHNIPLSIEHNSTLRTVLTEYAHI